MSDQKITIDLKGSIFAESQLQVSLPGHNQKLPRNGSAQNASPYFPATSIRGSIRHALHNVVVRATQNDGGGELQLDDHFMLAQGHDITGELMKESGRGQVDFYNELRRTNPALNLGGRWQLAARLSVDAAFPTNREDCITMIPGGVRSNMFRRNPDLLDILSESDTSRYTEYMISQAVAKEQRDDLAKEVKELKQEARKAEGQDKKRIFAEINQKEVEISELKKLADTKENDIVKFNPQSLMRPNEDLEVFSQGTEFNHRMQLTNCDPISIGLFLASLREFARSPYMGGKRSVGCGRVSAAWTARTWPADADQPITLGSIKMDDEGFVCDGELKNYLNEWDRVKLDLNGSGIDFTHKTASSADI